jgi:hypothetical protein
MSTEPTAAFDHSGSSFDDFLEEEGILDQIELVAIKRVIARRLPEPTNNAQPGTKQMKSERSR